MGFFKILGMVGASVVTGTAGIAAAVIEEVGAASGCEPLAKIGHSAKTVGFNATRQIWGKEKKEYEHSDGGSARRTIERNIQRKEEIIAKQEKRIAEFEKKHPGMNTKKVQQAKEQLNAAKGVKKNRRTDSELEQDRTGLSKKARDYQYQKMVPLSHAINQAESTTGVYVLYLNGNVMKCGRAAYGQGIHWRLQQYYSLNYDDKARNHDYWSVSPENRDSVMVSWQCCPVSKCKELEYKLFRKYGKGPWGLRAPQNCKENTWDLLI